MKLKQKSKFNTDASKLLIKNDCYAPSVHCSYYASFQLMKVVVKEFIGIDYNEIDRQVASTKSNEHKFIHRQILNFIHSNDYSEYTRMDRLVKDLFKFRIDSDYKDVEIKLTEAIKAQTKSQDIVSYIEENFHV